MKALVLAVLIVLAAVSARAQGARNCADRDFVVIEIGVAASANLVEVFASEETGSWTITVTTRNGPTCIVASGQSFELLREALPPRGSDL